MFRVIGNGLYGADDVLAHGLLFTIIIIIIMFFSKEGRSILGVHRGRMCTHNAPAKYPRPGGIILLCVWEELMCTRQDVHLAGLAKYSRCAAQLYTIIIYRTF